jgi:hydroxyacylglutathione hydrolase
LTSQSGATPAYELTSLVCGPLGNNVYVLIAPQQDGERAALVVDAAIDSVAAVTPLLAKAGVTLTQIVASHGHFDHVAELAELARSAGAQVLVHTSDAGRLRQPAPPVMFPDFVVEPVSPDWELTEGDEVKLGETTFQVLHTPGHTPGSLCLYDAAGGLLLSGDTLFAGSFGRYDLPGGDPTVLRQSLLRLSGLPPATRVLPGHGPATTIGRERWLPNPPL